MLSAITAAAATVLSATAITVADIITLAVPVEQSLLGVITYLLAVVLCVEGNQTSGPFGSNMVDHVLGSN
jgi:hypothetical protein